MISRSEFDAYNLAVDKIGNKAAADVESSVLSWCSQNPDASVAEKREAAKLIMEGYVQGYDDVASDFAAEWYDHRAKSDGISLDRAITMTVYSSEKTDAVARYQARKLMKGGDATFAKACGEYARNDAFRSLNETIIANVGRDKDKGAKFARVPTGFETCAFCIMLASRGAVYHTRKTAGEWKHFHRGCDCKVVPSFEDDPMATLVQGHDPWDAYRWWKRVDDARLSRSVVPNMTGMIESFQEGFDQAWKECTALGKTEEAYVKTVSQYIGDLVQENPIQIEPFTMLSGKEIMAAVQLSADGHSVVLRNADKHLKIDGNTSDALVDGVLCDFKKVTSPKIRKLVKEITGKLARQGPGFLVDISESRISTEAAEARIASLLDDPSIKNVYLINNGVMEYLKK